jgi:hypothetical protein
MESASVPQTGTRPWGWSAAISTVQDASGNPGAVWVTAVAASAAVVAALSAQLQELAWLVLEYLGAAYLSMRYFTGELTLTFVRGV